MRANRSDPLDVGRTSQPLVPYEMNQSQDGHHLKRLGSGYAGLGFTSHDASLTPGTTLGQYKIIRLLGRGGMGEVYEAEHTTLGLRYAMKLLPADFAARPGALERFRREARVMAQLHQRNGVTSRHSIPLK